jgi:hypothetical protein
MTRLAHSCAFSLFCNMPVYKSSNKGFSILTTVLLLAGTAVYCVGCKPAGDKKTLPEKEGITQPATDTIPAPRADHRLPDSTHVYLLNDTTKIIPHNDYPAHREIALDGDAFFYVPAATFTLIIHTKLLTLNVMGKAAFRVTAPSAEPWAEVDVINGTVIVSKAYSSTFNKPDTLYDSQMQMLNQTIDLMEKEDFDAAALKAWSSKLHR